MGDWPIEYTQAGEDHRWLVLVGLQLFWVEQYKASAVAEKQFAIAGFEGGVVVE